MRWGRDHTGFRLSRVLVEAMPSVRARWLSARHRAPGRLASAVGDGPNGTARREPAASRTVLTAEPWGIPPPQAPGRYRGRDPLGSRLNDFSVISSHTYQLSRTT